MALVTRESATNYSINLPTNRYTLRCKSCVLKDSKKSGKPMFEQDWEIADPEEVEVGDQKMKTDKIKIRNWVSFSEKAASMTFDFFAACGEEIAPFDPEDKNTLPDPSVWVGKCVNAVVNVKTRVCLDQNKQPILDDNGQPVTDGVNYEFGTVIGPAADPANAAF